jgi:hypothetical protein
MKIFMNILFAALAKSISKTKTRLKLAGLKPVIFDPAAGARRSKRKRVFCVIVSYREANSREKTARGAESTAAPKTVFSTDGGGK